MRHFLLFFFLLSFSVYGKAHELAPLNGAIAKVENGDIVIRFSGAKGEWPPSVRVVSKEGGAGGKKLSISFEAWSNEAVPARVSVSDAFAPFSHRAEEQVIQIGPKWKSYSKIFMVDPAAGSNLNLPAFVFPTFPTSGEVRLRNLKVVEVTRNWKPIAVNSLHIAPGSALDFSLLFENSPAGSYGRVIANRKGELAFASKPEAAVRFFSVQLIPPMDFTIWSDQDIADYATAVARQGYNMVRFHFFDNFINGDYRSAALKRKPVVAQRYILPEKPEDIIFDAHMLDRFHLLLAELKKRGIYWNLDLMTSFVGYGNNQGQDAPKAKGFNTKVQMFVNPNFRANWKAAVARLLGDVNPYTGMSIKDDPALAVVECLNEQEIIFEYRDYGREFDGVWHKYLARKYGNYQTMREAWGGKCGDVSLPETGDFADVPPIRNQTVFGDSPAARDMVKCCGEIEYEMAQWYRKTLDEMKFSGLSSNYNMRPRIGTVPARSLFPVITMNDYHAYPLYGEITSVSQRSSLVDGGSSFKSQSMTRFLDRPFMNTEFGHVFWNPFRHEQGLLHGSGAAFQGWGAITCHAGQVQDSGLALGYFQAGDDPVIRAAEAVEALVFRRGDVAPSPHTIEIPLTEAFISDGRGMKAIDDELSRLWMLCRVGITYGDKMVEYPKNISVSPDKMASIGGSIWFSDVAKSDTTARLTEIVKKLKEIKVLPENNISDPSAGILQSDTGELTLDTSAGGEMFVRTPRFEGAVIKTDKQLNLDAMSIDECTVPAAISIASIDKKNSSIRDAKRLLLIISTDARNSDMKFTSAAEDKVISLGSMPILMRTGKFKIDVQRSQNAKSVVAYALGLNGERVEEVQIINHGRSFSMEIDTDSLKKSGPTPFFEIQVED